VRHPSTGGYQHPPTASLHGSLAQLDARGGLTLPGRPNDATLRWLSRRNRLLACAIGTLIVGALLAVLGIALRDLGVWALAMPLGGFLAFVGAISTGLVLLLRRLMSPRLVAESHPVTIDRHGIVLRGIGPIPWSDVAPPQRMLVRVKNDIGGPCTVMPLTQQGHARVNAQPGWWMNLVGPKPYLRFDIPYLLLPGIDGLTEEETLHLFQIAHERFAR